MSLFLTGTASVNSNGKNLCSYGAKDKKRESQYFYAHNIRYRRQKHLVTKWQVNQELNTRPDKKEILEILSELDQQTKKGPKGVPNSVKELFRGTSIKRA